MRKAITRMPYISPDTPVQTKPRRDHSRISHTHGKKFDFSASDLPFSKLFPICSNYCNWCAGLHRQCHRNATGVARVVCRSVTGTLQTLQHSAAASYELPSFSADRQLRPRSFSQSFRSFFAIRPGTNPQFSQSARSLFAVRPATNSGTRPRGQRRTETLQIDAPRSPLLDSPQATASPRNPDHQALTMKP